jgi:flagellar protein FliO/FliZ
MFSSLILLSASVVATPVFISEVHATREAGHLRVDVRADGGIDPEAARTKIDEGRLFLFLGGARVKADNRSWNLEDGTGSIRAHRHHSETELDVPLAGNGCSGPVELEESATGITALVGCDGEVPARAAKVDRVDKVELKAASRGAGPTDKTAAVVLTDMHPGALAATTSGATTKEPTKASPKEPTPALKALVALPEEPAAEPEAKAPEAKAKAPEVEVKTPAAKPVDTKSSATKLADAEPTAPTVPAQKVPAAVIPADTALLAPAKSFGALGTAAATTTAPSGGSGFGSVALPALFLAGLALVAYWFARRRRGVSGRQIEILETASLGPKRSLVMARIGDQTMILGSSEAGITLLQMSGGVTTTTTTGGGAAPDAPAPVAIKDEMDQPIAEALADIPEPGEAPPVGLARAGFRSIEGGLASFFGRAPSVPAREEPNFDDMLEDSVEDQELRRKLAAGLSARVR